uniref:Uncharacterized protein n=1 Tax=Rhodococcus sp. Mel TaxID=1093626 RepID=H8ZKU6_9NOCA|nr:hypothetical protein [Rhodococcus sp. Mel]
MFESWQHSPTLHVFDPPRPVEVALLPTLSWAFMTAGRSPVSLETRAFGLRVERSQPGRQLAWIRANSGSWIGLVICEVESSNSKCSVQSQFWLPPDRIRVL